LVGLVAALAGAAQAGEVGEAVMAADEQPAIEVEIVEFGPVPVAFTAHTGSFEKIGEAIPALLRGLGEQRIVPSGPVMGIFHNDPKSVPEEKLRWEVAIEVPEAAVPNKPLKARVIPKCTVARAEYKGPAQEIGAVYQALVREALTRGYVPAGPAIELFGGAPEDGVIECTAMFVVRKAPPLEVEFVGFGPQTVAYSAHTGSYKQIPKAIEAFRGALGKQGIEPEGPLMGIYFSDPNWTPEEELQWEIAAPVPAELDVAEPLDVKRIKKCTVARAAYTGPEEELSVAYLALLGQAARREYVPVGPAIQIFGEAPKDGEIECTIMFVVRRLNRIHNIERMRED
jgi:DNA gyrase inhibitor GyrI